MKPWVDLFYEAREQEKGAIIIGFRGSGKSTVAAAWVAWQILQDPETINAIYRANEYAAAEAGQHIATMIQYNPAWQLYAPHIIPDLRQSEDKKQGGRGAKWSRTGYNVIDTRVPEGLWYQRQAQRQHPSLYSLPYKSAAIMGKRCTGVLLFDDIHDETNTSSERELDRLIAKVDTEIMETRVPETEVVFISNAWLPNDINEQKRQTGEYLYMKTAAIQPDGTATWPERISLEYLEKRRKDIGDARFAQLYMCDASQMQNRTFTYVDYPKDLLKETFAVHGGIDFAAHMTGQSKTRHQSHFAEAYIMDHPDGFNVVYDGVLKQCNQTEAERIIVASQERFPVWMGANFELDGKGETFYEAVMTSNPGLRLTGVKTGGIKKEMRWEDFLQPLFADYSLRVATGESYFLRMLRELLEYYPNVGRGHPGRDAMDAVFWAMRFKLMKRKGNLIMKQKKGNPFATLARAKL